MSVRERHRDRRSWASAIRITVKTWPNERHASRRWPGLGASLIALAALIGCSESIHEDLRSFERIELNPETIVRAAKEGKSVPLTLGRESFDLWIHPADALAPNARILDEAGQLRELESSVLNFAARVATEPAATARLSVHQERLFGIVRVGGETWFIQPTRTITAEAEPHEHIAYRWSDTRLELDFGQDERLPRTPTPQGLQQSAHGTPLTAGLWQKILEVWFPFLYPTYPIGVIWVADDEVAAFTTSVFNLHYSDYQIVVTNLLSAIYRSQVGAVFQARYFFRERNDDLSSTNADKLLNQLELVVEDRFANIRSREVRRASDVEIAHLTTGKDLDGSTIGIGWEPGQYSLSEHRSSPLIAYSVNTTAHEFGHNFHAVHAQADKWCVTHFITCLDYRRSLMWPKHFSDNTDYFSRGNRWPWNDNRGRVLARIARLPTQEPPAGDDD